MHESILLYAGCLPLSPEFALLKKITTLSQFQGHLSLWHRSSVGQALLLPEAQPIQFPWHWGSIKGSHFLQQRDLARPVDSPNLREAFYSFSCQKICIFSNAHQKFCLDFVNKNKKSKTLLRMTNISHCLKKKIVTRLKDLTSPRNLLKKHVS